MPTRALTRPHCAARPLAAPPYGADSADRWATSSTRRSQTRRQKLVRTRARASAMGAPMEIADSQRPEIEYQPPKMGLVARPHPPSHPCTLTPRPWLVQALRDARLALAHGGRSHPASHAVAGATTLITLWDFRRARGRDGGALHREALPGAPPPDE
eukprot:scaffold54672_cov62-Phaeocystis_antarctica.AAC.4